MPTPVTQDLIIGKRESVEENYIMLNPNKLPILQKLGISSMDVMQIEHKWYEDILITDKTTLATTVDNAITTVVVAAGDGVLFRADDVFVIGEESIKVVSIATDTLTVTRAYRGTTATAHTAGAFIEIVAQATEEGSDARDRRYKPRTSDTNFTEIYRDTISFSGTALAISQYGINDLYRNEQDKTESYLFKKLERNIIKGVKYASGDEKERYSGGIRHFVTSNLIDGLGTKVPDLQLLKDIVRPVWENGGFEDATDYVFIMSPIMNEIYSNLQVAAIRTERSDQGLGNVAMNFLCEYSTTPIPFMMSEDVDADEILFIDFNRMQVKRLNGRGFTHEFLGKDGDRTEGEIVGEYTLQFEQESAHTRAKSIKID